MEQIKWAEGLSDEELTKYSMSKIIAAETARNIHTGRKRSKDTIKKMSASQKGVKKKKESVERMRKSLTGRSWNSDLKYTDEELFSIAKKYNRRQDFKNNDRNACKAARSRGKDFFNKVCAHMTGGRRIYGTYTFKEISVRAKRFKRRGDFAKGDKAAYYHAWKQKWLDKLFPKKKSK